MGKAIVISDVDYSGLGLGRINFIGEENEATILYNAYIAKTGRSASPQLYKFLQELTALNISIRSLYYLASGENNIEHVKYNIFNLNESLAVNGNVVIGATGIKSTTGGYLMDNGSYDVTKGLTTSHMVSSAANATNKYEWGAFISGNVVSLATSGGYNSQIIRRGGSAVTLTEDTSGTTGTYTVSINTDNTLRYRHGSVSIDKELTPTISTFVEKLNPYLLNYNGGGSEASDATIKLYLVVESSISAGTTELLHNLVDQYKDLM